jgi:hypothetical protein
MRRVLALAALAGCSLSADFGGTRFRCDDGVCPAGQTCVGGFCETGVPDAPPAIDAPAAPDAPPGTPDASSPDAAPPAGPCGTVSLLTDDFGDGVEDTRWAYSFASNGTARAEVGGRLRLTLNEVATSAYAGRESTHHYDLRESRAWVEVPTVPNGATFAQAAFILGRDGQDRLSILYEQDDLHFRYEASDVIQPLGSVPYDSMAHRYWQLRAAGTTVYWETSPDGVNWTERAMADPPFALDHLRIILTAGTYALETAPGVAEFDNLNGGGPPTGSWCKAETFQDDFEDGVRGAEWGRSYGGPGGCSHMETGGQLVETPPVGATGYCARVTGKSYELLGSSFQVEVPEMLPVSSPALGYLKLSDYDDENGVEITQAGGLLKCLIWAGGASSPAGPTVTWSGTMHRFWRIREAAGTIFWETSPDGAAWNPLCDAPTTVDLTYLEIALGVGTPTVLPSAPGELRWDNVNP